MGILHLQPVVIGRRADYGVGAAFAAAQGIKACKRLRCDCEHVALLRFVAPDFAWAHARLFAGRRAQINFRPASRSMRDLGQRIGDAPRADVVNREHRVGIAQLPAAVDDFLRAALDLGIAALHRIEVQVFRIGSGIHAGGGAAAHADQHPRPAKLD